jgi:hypothetical protein
MADFGLYSALSQPRRNWAQVRQDRMMELGMLQNMQQDLKQRVDAESQARAGVVEYMNELQKSSVLEGDYERVKAVEEAERKKIVEGIQKAGNNVQKFLNGDGASILNNYRNNIIQSDEMRNAISNKLAFGQAGLDKYMGRIARPTYDEQGNRISFDQQVEQFQNGERERLEYQGSVQPVDMTKIRSTIQSTYGEDRYKRQAAGADDVYNIARELGAEDWMAEDIRDGYAAGVESGAEPLRWKWDEAPKASGADYMSKALEAMLKQNPTKALFQTMNGTFSESSDIKENKDGTVSERLITPIMNPKAVEQFLTLSGVSSAKGEDGSIVYSYTGQNAYGAKGETPIDLSGAKIDPTTVNIVTKKIYVPDGDKYKTQPYYSPDGSLSLEGQPFIELEVYYDNEKEARAAGNMGMRSATFGEMLGTGLRSLTNPAELAQRGGSGVVQGLPQELEGGGEAGNFKYVKGKGYGGKVLIPMSTNVTDLSYGEQSTPSNNMEDFVRIMYNQFQYSGQ